MNIGYYIRKQLGKATTPLSKREGPGVSLLGVSLLLLVGLLCSCSETKNLAEGETLYVGIKKVNYDKPVKPETDNDTTGVITALGNAYTTVSGLMAGDPSAQEVLTNLQSDSLIKAQAKADEQWSKQDREAYALAKSEVEGVLAYAPNNSLMGSSYYRQPLAFGLWAYNKYVYSQKRFGKWMFNTFAASPIYMTTVNPRVRTQVARNTLRNYGYFRGQASYEDVPQKNPKKAKVSYDIHPGPLFHLDSISYLGFTETADSLIRKTMSQTKLHSGAPFSVPNLDAERQRLSTLFRNNGYYYHRPEYIVYRADTIVRPLHVQLQATPAANTPDEANRQFRMGNTRIKVYRNEDTELVDTLRRPEKMSRHMRKQIEKYRKQFAKMPEGQRPRMRRRNSILMAYSGKPGRPPLKMQAFYRYINYRSGDLYSQSALTAMQENLIAMGIFSQVNIKLTPNSTSPSTLPEREGTTALKKDSLSFGEGQGEALGDSIYSPDSLDVDITLRLDKPYDAEFKGNVATKSNGLVGPGVSFSMSKQNIFRGAETFSLQAYGSYEWMTGAQLKGKHSLMNSYEWGASANLTYPRLLLLGLGQQFNRRAQATTTYKLSADWINRSGYFSRVSFGARVIHTYQRRKSVYHEIVPFRLEYEKQLHTTEKFESIINENQALYASLRDQFVPSAQYTIALTNPNSRYHQRRITLSIKEAGNFTSLIYRAAGQSFTEKDKNLFGVPFAQYVRLTAEYSHRYRIAHTQTYLCWRAFGGIVHSFGNSTIAPYSDLFTVGGANSIRAFGVRSIGPGRYHPGHSHYSYLNQMGDLKLEANLEYRFPLVSKLQGALFVDAGNVWLMKEDENRPGGNIDFSRIAREIALGTGFGLRYDLSFLVIRFDVGVGIHAPYDTGHSGYYNMGKFWNSLGFHLAVGYPF